MDGTEQLLIATRMGGGTDREREEGGESVVPSYLKKHQNAPRPSEHLPVRGKKCQRLGGIKGCKYKTSS